MIFISGAHFMNNFSIIVHSQWKLHSDPIQVVMLWWLWNFAHGITAVLLSHVQNFLVIWIIVIEWNYIKTHFSSNLNYDGKKIVKWAPGHWNGVGSWNLYSWKNELFILHDQYHGWCWQGDTYKEPQHQQPSFFISVSRISWNHHLRG